MNENVCAVIVTYSGDRLPLLKRSVAGALAAGCRRVLIVDNGSSSAVRSGILNMVGKNPESVSFVSLEENRGSAGGFREGIAAFQRDVPECPFVWLLDDDNIPEKPALATLFAHWRRLPPGKEGLVTLASFRKDRPFDRQVLLERDIERRFWRKNSFLGFHGADLPIRLGGSKKNREDGEAVPRDAREIHAGTYGGLFLHRDLLCRIGYPDEDLFTYQDDTEYTYRIKKSGGASSWSLTA
ncbi:MAG: glycosyltransferase [Candidatus Aminicenantes bacterium]|nr:glycosyltransferase [Candidatus Aminicenantes bacterium]